MKRAIALLLAAMFTCCAFAYCLGETLEAGSKGESVRKLQQRLKDLGYFDGKITGTYNARTQDAVLAFKGQVGMPMDDIADEATQARLFADDAPKCVAFDYTLLEENVESYYFDDAAGKWVWESSANYLDEEHWPRDVKPGELYVAMGIYATGGEKGTNNRITWKFLCYDEEGFNPDTLTVTLPDGEAWTAKITKAHRSSNEFIDELGTCTVVSATLGTRGIDLLVRIAGLSDDELRALKIVLSDGEREIEADPFQSTVSYNPFIDDLRAFITAWGACGGFSAPMAREDKSFIAFKKAGEEKAEKRTKDEKKTDAERRAEVEAEDIVEIIVPEVTN